MMHLIVVIAVVIILAVGLVTAHLVSRSAAKADAARARERETRQLYEAARDMAGAHDVTQVGEAARRYLGNHGLGGKLLLQVLGIAEVLRGRGRLVLPLIARMVR